MRDKELPGFAGAFLVGLIASECSLLSLALAAGNWGKTHLIRIGLAVSILFGAWTIGMVWGAQAIPDSVDIVDQVLEYIFLTGTHGALAVLGASFPLTLARRLMRAHLEPLPTAIESPPTNIAEAILIDVIIYVAIAPIPPLLLWLVGSIWFPALSEDVSMTWGTLFGSAVAGALVLTPGVVLGLGKPGGLVGLGCLAAILIAFAAAALVATTAIIGMGNAMASGGAPGNSGMGEAQAAIAGASLGYILGLTVPLAICQRHGVRIKRSPKQAQPQ